MSLLYLKSVRLHICWVTMAVCYLSSCYFPQSSDKELIRPWLGRKAITAKTSYLVPDVGVWFVALPKWSERRGWHMGDYFLSPNIEFKIEGIEVNRSPFSGPCIWIIASSPAISNRRIQMAADSWGTQRWRALTFQEQLQPKNVHLFFEGNPNFSLR
jgi:hypothetical protein